MVILLNLNDVIEERNLTIINQNQELEANYDDTRYKIAASINSHQRNRQNMDVFENKPKPVSFNNAQAGYKTSKYEDKDKVGNKDAPRKFNYQLKLNIY